MYILIRKRTNRRRNSGPNRTVTFTPALTLGTSRAEDCASVEWMVFSEKNAGGSWVGVWRRHGKHAAAINKQPVLQQLNYISCPPRMVPDVFYTIHTVIAISSFCVVADLSHVFSFIQNPMAAPANQCGFLANTKDRPPGRFFSIERIGENVLTHANLALKYSGAKAAKLTKVNWCKCKKKPEHEFLLIYVQETVSPNRTAIIMVERLFNLWAAQQEINGQGTTMAEDIFALSYTADESSVTVRQFDHWTMWESMDLTTHNISLMQLADVVEAVHRYCPNYSMTSQCHFFARTTFNALRSLAGMDLWKPSGKKWRRAGHLNGLSVPEDNFAEINQQVVDIYQDVLDNSPPDSYLTVFEQGQRYIEERHIEERRRRVQAEERIAELQGLLDRLMQARIAPE